MQTKTERQLQARLDALDTRLRNVEAQMSTSAPTAATLRAMTKYQLLEYLMARGLPAPSSSTKAELLEIAQTKA